MYYNRNITWYCNLNKSELINLSGFINCWVNKISPISMFFFFFFSFHFPYADSGCLNYTHLYKSLHWSITEEHSWQHHMKFSIFVWLKRVYDFEVYIATHLSSFLFLIDQEEKHLTLTSHSQNNLPNVWYLANQKLTNISGW